MRAAAERGSGASGTGVAALMAPLLQNLVLSAGDNEELAYCLKAWQALPDTVKTGRYPAKDDALKVCAGPRLLTSTQHHNMLLGTSLGLAICLVSEFGSYLSQQHDCQL